MVGDTPTPPKPPIDKAYSIASIKACIPTPLDLDKLNYNSWSSLFQRFCKTYEVHHHLAAPSTTATSTVDPLHDTNDSLVVMWIYATISPKLVEMIVDVDSTAHGVWNRLKDLFHDNKDARITQLDNEIRNMAIGNLSITDFFQQLKSKADRLANLESPVKDTSLVTYAINGVRSKYPDAARVIRLREKAPTFDELRSLMLLEESDMSNSSHGNSSFHNTSSSPTVLVASTSNANKTRTMSTSGLDVCRNFQRGSCTYGARCKFVHGANDLRPRPSNVSAPQSRAATVPPNARTTPSHNNESQKPTVQTQNLPSGMPYVASNVQPTYTGGPTNMGYLFFNTGPGVYNPYVPSPQAHLTSTHGPFQPAQHPLQAHQFQSAQQFQPAQQLQYGLSGPPGFGSPNMKPIAPPQASHQATMLPHAFQTMTLQEPAWNMDTGASSHLAENTGMLTSFSNPSMYKSVFVGNGQPIPVTHTGHSLLHTLHKPLHLHHVLVTPNIIKNLISVRQFTRDNNVSVDFDAYGFSVKDYQTRRLLLLRCDSTGDLYPVTQQPSTTSTFALLTLSPTTWHRRLGHPSDDVLRRLESSHFISCNKSKLSALCHACQLGKHTKLPFYSSVSHVASVFDIVHSDLWTSPISSESGIKYYAIFLDHFSHYVWVYPLLHKSDLFDTFVTFRAYVNQQFNVDIKALQCDHGGEFDNTRFHTLFRQHGIQFRFSCPKTSQQNGKSERMLRTLNNITRTLLFQAHIPPSYWVEALNMAAHLLNILPSSAINNEIPFTKLYNKPPTYDHLRVFGCLCFPHIFFDHKLQPRSTACVFLGYPALHRGYRCLDLSTNKIIISIWLYDTRYPTFIRLFAYTSQSHSTHAKHTCIFPST
ncbi:ribonuclease H-like domain-containing protein [Tanacetum coccineum]